MKLFLRLAGRLAGIVALTIALTVIARAQGDDITPDPFQKSKEPVYLTPQADRALLYVARPDYTRVFGLSTFKVFMDDKAAGWLPQRSYLAVQVEPGPRLIWGPSQNEAQRFTFEAGKTYLLVLAERYVTYHGGSAPTSSLEKTWWIPREPEDIKSLVPSAKLEYVNTLEKPLAELGKEAAKKYAKTSEKARDVTELSLPVSFETVWYRQGKKKFMLKPFEATGTLTISRETIEYQSDKKTLIIPVKDVQKVSLNSFVTFGVAAKDEWGIVRYTAEGSEEVIGFRDGRSFGTGANTGLIYRALLDATQGRLQPSSPGTSAPALAGQAPASAAAEVQMASPPPAQPAINPEGQPAPSSGSQSAEPQSLPTTTSPEQGAPTAHASVPQEKTLASDVLQRDTLRVISLLDGAEDPTCNAKRRVLKMEITTPPVGVKVKRNRMVAGWWEERWTIDRCGTPVPYDISYSSDGHGGTNIASRMAPVLEQEKKTDTATPPPLPPAGENPRPASSSTQSTTAGTSPGSPLPASGNALPEGFVLYEGQKDQFTIAIPQGWAARDQSQILQAKGNSPFNLTFFYLPPKGTPQDSITPEVLMKIVMSIDTGEIPSFFVQKLKAGDGMSCEGFSEKAEKKVFKLVTGDPMFGKGATVLEPPRSEPISVAGFKGIRIYGTGKAAKEDTPQTSDVHAVSDGKILYLFSLRGSADNCKKNAEIFQKSVSTAKLTAVK